MEYSVPQVQVYQVSRLLPRAVTKNLNACIVGPQFQLFRYSEATERALAALGAYDLAADQTFAWPNKPVGAIADVSYAALYASDLEARYATAVSGVLLSDSAALATLGVRSRSRNIVRFPSRVVATANGTTATAPAVVAGDRIAYEVDGVRMSARVTGFVADRVAASVADAVADVAADANAATAATAGEANVSDTVPSVVGTAYADPYRGVISDTFSVTVATAGAAGVATVDIASASGNYDRSDVPVLAYTAEGSEFGAVYIGLGITLVLSSDYDAALDSDDTFEVTVVAEHAAATAASGGTYVGTVATTYNAVVERGGSFEDSAVVTEGIANAVATPALSAVLTDYAAGMPDDEYIVTCVTAGTIGTTARFSIVSAAGESVASASIGTAATSVGERGLKLLFAGAGSAVLGDTWAVAVRATLPLVRIYDSVGSDVSGSVYVNDAVAVALGGNGVTLTIADNAQHQLVAGDAFTVAATAATAGAVRSVVLAAPIEATVVENSAMDFDLCLVKTDYAIPELRLLPGAFNWTADADGITALAAMAIDDARVPGVELPVQTADLVAQYRALIVGNAASLQLAADAAGVEDLLGTVDPDNPLAMGTYQALLNSGARGVYYLGLVSNDIAGWNRAIDILSGSKDVYGLVPMSDDVDVLTAFEAHINASSTPFVRRWRLGFFGAIDDIVASLYPSRGAGSDSPIYAEVSGTGFDQVTFVDADGNPDLTVAAEDNIRVGDSLRIGYGSDAWGAQTYYTGTVSAVTGAATLTLVADELPGVYAVPTRAEVWRTRTAQERAVAVAAKSQGYYNKRIVNVFPGTAFRGTTALSGSVLAAGIAGMVSAVSPQAPLTNVEVEGVTDIPATYSTFTPSQLDVMAGAGTLIVMQDAPSEQAYVRHQLTTRTSGGDLNETELSLVKNLDSVSYYFAARFRPFIGRYNITPGLLARLEGIVTDSLMYLTSFTDVGDIGPQVIASADTSLESLVQHPTLRDTVMATINLDLPAPFNTMQLVLAI